MVGSHIEVVVGEECLDATSLSSSEICVKISVEIDHQFPQLKSALLEESSLWESASCEELAPERQSSM